MKVFENDKIAVYQNKDDRFRAYIKSEKRVISYPRILMEEKIGRPLDQTEQVHHLNEDVTDNDPDNLSIELLGPHQKMHADSNRKYHDTIAICAYCRKLFLWTAEAQRDFDGRRSKLIKRNIPLQFGPFCSRTCSGKFGADIQRQQKVQRLSFME